MYFSLQRTSMETAQQTSGQVADSFLVPGNPHRDLYGTPARAAFLMASGTGANRTTLNPWKKWSTYISIILGRKAMLC